jgi:hypothetical protein
MISSKCSSFWLTILCFVDMFFNKLSGFFYGCELCPSSRWLVPLLIRGRLQTGASQEKRKDAIPIFNFVDPIYSIEFEIKDTTDTARAALYPDIHIKIDSEGQLRTKLYDKRDDFYFLIVNFPFLCSNIPAAPAYGVYISQLIRYTRACGSYNNFFNIGLLLTRELLNHGFLVV